MGHTLREAAALCGRSRSTIHRALKNGKLSGSRSEDGAWSIDAAELARVFPWDTAGHVPRDKPETATENTGQAELLELKVAMLEQQLEREQETVADLRKRLDRAEDRVTALTDQRQAQGSSTGLLGRLFGRRE